MITLVDALPGSGMSLGTPSASTSGPGSVARPGSGGECIPSKANLDLNDKLIKRGKTVSWHGWRGIVQRVRTGRCLVKFHQSQPDATLVLKPTWLDCSTVQVVS